MTRRNKHPRDRWLNRLRERVVLAKCASHGHRDFGCYSAFGSIGDRCSRCGRIQWQLSYWGNEGTPQEPTFPTLYTDHGKPNKGWWK